MNGAQVRVTGTPVVDGFIADDAIFLGSESKGDKDRSKNIGIRASEHSERPQANP